METINREVAVLEQRRLDAVRKTGLLDSGQEESFDRLTRLASVLIGAPVAFISLVDEGRDFYKSCYGFPEPLASARQLEGETFCHYTIGADQPLIIPDTRADPKYRNVPTVHSLGIAAYLGIPLITRDGLALGSFCLIDFEPRAWTARDVEIARELAASAMREIELREALRATSEQEDQFKSLADSIPQLAWMADGSGKVFWYNRRWHEYTGKALEQMQGRSGRQVHHPDEVERVIERFREHIESGEPYEDTFPLRGADGQYRWFLSRALPIRDEAGQIVRWFGTNTDVTRDRELYAKAQQAIKARDEVLAIVSHDLRNPANTVFMAAGLLLDYELDADKKRQQLQVIQRAALQITGLIQDLLDVTRAESATLPLQLQPELLEPLVIEVVSGFALQAEARGLTLESNLSPAAAAAPMDRQRVVQILSNLIGNSLKFTPRGGKVRLEVAAEPGGIRFVVRDTGAGIPEDELAHVFDRFWQATRNRRAGAGLGLAISKAIVHAHGGEIGVESVVGQGSNFWFTLPRQVATAT